MKLSKQNIIALWVCLVAVLLFIIFKITKYNLCYYTTDLFSCLQITRSWLQGQPFLWENRFGHTGALHINFISVLFTPFSILAGAKGLFIEHAIILLLATAWFVIRRDAFIEENFWPCFSIMVLLMLGPFSFWIFDNPYLGWFFDLLFLPFSLMFAMALKSSKKWAILITGILMAMTKEDGAVIACVIMLYATIISHDVRLPKNILFKKLLLITGFWLAVFSLSIFYLYSGNDFKTAKVNFAFDTFSVLSYSTKVSYFKGVLSGFALMILPLMILFATFFSFRYLFLLSVVLLPVIVIGLISGFCYAPNQIFSLTWTARFCEVLGVFAAASVLSMKPEMMNPQILTLSRNKTRLAFFVLFIFCFEILSLHLVRNYKFAAVVVAVFRSDLPAGVTPQKIETMKCVAQNIPDSCVVVLPENYYNVFEDHRYAWFDHLENAPHLPDLAVFDNERYYNENVHRFPGYETVRVNDFYLLKPKNAAFDLTLCGTANP